MSVFKKINVTSEHGGQVMGITLNVPKGNILDRQMIGELISALEETANRAAVKIVIFRAAGDHFSFGASVEEHKKEVVREMLPLFNRLFKTLIALDKPTCAVVRGQCLGGGMELATFCNWIFAAPNAIFGQPEIMLAVYAPVASLALPLLIGQSRADDLLLTGRSINAAEAHQIGLIRAVAEDPEAALQEFLIKHILLKSAVALQHAHRAARAHFNQVFLRHIDTLEKSFLDELMKTHDASEGIAAFLEKRPPEWNSV
jgi:cyclohexa-1,5-dienecarbonyl-CoA hydratase